MPPRGLLAILVAAHALNTAPPRSKPRIPRRAAPVTRRAALLLAALPIARPRAASAAPAVIEEPPLENLVAVMQYRESVASLAKLAENPEQWPRLRDRVDLFLKDQVRGAPLFLSMCDQYCVLVRYELATPPPGAAADGETGGEGSAAQQKAVEAKAAADDDRAARRAACFSLTAALAALRAEIETVVTTGDLSNALLAVDVERKGRGGGGSGVASEGRAEIDAGRAALRRVRGHAADADAALVRFVSYASEGEQARSRELIAAMLNADVKPRNGRVEADEFAMLTSEQGAVVRRMYETVRHGL